MSQPGCGQTGLSAVTTHSILRPRFPSSASTSQPGRGQPEHVSATSTGASHPGCGQTECDPTPTPSLNVKFINSARFRKFACNNPCTALWYHPEGSRGYSVAAATFGSTPLTATESSSLPSDSSPPTAPPPKPPPADDFLQHVPEKYHDLASVFSPVEVDQLPPHRPGFDAAIELEDGKSPPFGPLYHLSQQEREVLFNYVETNLRKGFICRSSSAAASPVLFVRKKEVFPDVCVDYRGLNAITKKNRYPLPLIDDLLDRVQGCKVFSVLDLK
ncbi:DNA/RNA polymerase, partial [Lentinus tigrinus ALCF2SS1-7]|uniref:DNA/RNA polymerase n=1 Tax=Lentinus tigrinus ALCF2SS1-7 TaxID=1328758 RepID=UPI00116634FA